MEDKWRDERIQIRKVEKILPMFKNDGERLFYNGNPCVTIKHMSDVLKLAHDSKIRGHLVFGSKLSKLSNFHWRHKSRDVLKHVEGCMRFQQLKDSNQEKLTDSVSLELPGRRWAH